MTLKAILLSGVFLVFSCIRANALITEYNVKTNGWRDGERIITIKYDATLKQLVVRFQGFPPKTIKSRLLEISGNGESELQVEIAESTKDPNEIRFKLARSLIDRAQLIVLCGTAVETSPDAYRLQLGEMLRTQY